MSGLVFISLLKVGGTPAKRRGEGAEQGAGGGQRGQGGDAADIREEHNQSVQS